jgi:hypothetical protein
VTEDSERIRQLTERIALLSEQVDWLERRLRLLERLAYLPGPPMTDPFQDGDEVHARP